MVMAIFRIWWVNCWPSMQPDLIKHEFNNIYFFEKTISILTNSCLSLHRIYKALTLHDFFSVFPPFFFFFFFYRKIILHHGGVMSTLDREFTGSWDKWFHTLVIDQLLKSNTQSVVPEFHLTNTWKSSYHSFVMSVFI